MGKLENDIRELEKELRVKANEYDGLSDENRKDTSREEIKKMIMKLYVLENPTQTAEEISSFENYIIYYLCFVSMDYSVDNTIDNISRIRSNTTSKLVDTLYGLTRNLYDFTINLQQTEADVDLGRIKNEEDNMVEFYRDRCIELRKLIIEFVEQAIKHHRLTDSEEETQSMISELKSIPTTNDFNTSVYEIISQLNKNRNEDEPSTGNPNR